MSRARACESRRRAGARAHESPGTRGYCDRDARVRLAGLVLRCRRLVDAERHAGTTLIATMPRMLLALPLQSSWSSRRSRGSKPVFLPPQAEERTGVSVRPVSRAVEWSYFDTQRHARPSEAVIRSADSSASGLLTASLRSSASLPLATARGRRTVRAARRARHRHRRDARAGVRRGRGRPARLRPRRLSCEPKREFRLPRRFVRVAWRRLS